MGNHEEALSSAEQCLGMRVNLLNQDSIKITDAIVDIGIILQNKRRA